MPQNGGLGLALQRQHHAAVRVTSQTEAAGVASQSASLALPHSRCCLTASVTLLLASSRSLRRLRAQIASEPKLPHRPSRLTGPVASQPALPHSLSHLRARHLTARIASQPASPQSASPHSPSCLAACVTSQPHCFTASSPHSPCHLAASSPHSPCHFPDRAFQLPLSSSPAALHRSSPPSAPSPTMDSSTTAPGTWQLAFCLSVTLGNSPTDHFNKQPPHR